MTGTAADGSKTGSAVLAKLIRERRQQLGMSRQDLAETTGVPYSTLAQIETAYRGVSPSRLGVIARALQLNPKELYDILASDQPSLPPPPAAASAPPPRLDNDSWHANPAYITASLTAAATRMVTTTEEPESMDIVDQVVALLSSLPAAPRLDALGRVQSQLLSGLVQDEIRQATLGAGGKRAGPTSG